MRIVFDHEIVYWVALNLGLKSRDMFHNWLREYRKSGYNIINKQRKRPSHDQKRTANQTVKPATQAKEQTLTPEALKAENRERICKKLSVLVDQRTKNHKPRK